MADTSEAHQLDKLLEPESMFNRVMQVHEFIMARIEENPREAFEPSWFEIRGTDEHKQLVNIDKRAEYRFGELLLDEFRQTPLRDMAILGEESLSDPSLNLTARRKLHVLLDTIDGTDLLERGFSNWCTAIVIFHPDQKKILGAYVVTRAEFQVDMYYINYRMRRSAKMSRVIGPDAGEVSSGERLLELPGESRTKRLEDCSICMYGQKVSSFANLLSLSSNPAFSDWLASAKQENNVRRSARKKELGFRFYNLAGNPMMARLAEGRVDVVFEIAGQLPHDVVPGAMVALGAGASMKDMSGRTIDEEYLAEKLLTPASAHIRYVLGCSSECVDKMIGFFDSRLSD